MATLAASGDGERICYIKYGVGMPSIANHNNCDPLENHLKYVVV